MLWRPDIVENRIKAARVMLKGVPGGSDHVPYEAPWCGWIWHSAA